jgi:sodium borate transporter 11
MFTEQTLYPPIHYIRKVPQKAVHTFTALQLLQLGVLCGLSFSGIAYLKMLFPFIIIALIPIRKFLIPKAIHEDHLEALDGSH